MSTPVKTHVDEPVIDPWDNHGGPAHPVQAGDVTYKGMSMRDYFAGNALIGMLIADGGADSCSWSAFASDAYTAADAMLVAREAKKAE